MNKYGVLEEGKERKGGLKPGPTKDEVRPLAPTPQPKTRKCEAVRRPSDWLRNFHVILSKGDYGVQYETLQEFFAKIEEVELLEITIEHSKGIVNEAVQNLENVVASLKLS